MYSYRVVSLTILSVVSGTAALFLAEPVRAQQTPPRVVENVDINGNRRLRKDDIIYYIQTRAGDNYNPDQVTRDLQTILSLGFFDKVGTGGTEEVGPRGGVIITFIAVGLPIIRDIPFQGLRRVSASDILITFPQRRFFASKDVIEEPGNRRQATRALLK